MHKRYDWGGIQDFDCPEIHFPINIKYFPLRIHTIGRLYPGEDTIIIYNNCNLSTEI